MKKDSSLFSDSRKGGTQVLSGTVTADRDGVFATSIPLQKGMELLIDGKPAELITVNEAFAGALMKQGMHTVELRFSPPGKTAGCILSLTSAAGYGLFLIWSLLRFWKRGRELTAYLVSGCITTGVNYCLVYRTPFIRLSLGRCQQYRMGSRRGDRLPAEPKTGICFRGQYSPGISVLFRSPAGNPSGGKYTAGASHQPGRIPTLPGKAAGQYCDRGRQLYIL